MLERRSALAAHPCNVPGTRVGPPDQTDARVRVAERRPLAILQVNAFGDTHAQTEKRLAEVFGIPAPAPNRWSGTRERNLRLTGPGTWQIVGNEGGLLEVPALRQDLADIAAVVDLSHARTALHVAGPAAPATLAKHCGLDLHASSFPTGSATNTRFGHLGITLARLGDAPTFELLVFRGYAEFVFDALIEAGREYGLLVAA